MKAIFCATRFELSSIDTTYIKMMDISVTDSLLEGIQTLTEGESDTIIFSEYILEEQMSEVEFNEYITLLNTLYPKRVRFVYVKYKRSSDNVVDTMYQYDNWDVYYNTKIVELSDSQIVSLYEDRKMPDINYKRKVSMEEIIESGLKLKDTLLEDITTSTDISTNMAFQSTINRNINLTKDMVVTLDYLQKDLYEERKQMAKLEATIMKANQTIIELNNSNGELQNDLKKSKDVGDKLFAELTKVQIQYNSLIDSLKDLLYVDRVNTVNYRTKEVSSKFRKAPTVLYFKQVSHINHFTRYVKNLSKIMNQSLGETKLYVIESESNLLSIPRYTRKGFSYITHGTPLAEFILGDLITCGVDTKVMDFLIDNSLNLDYLIIVDKTGVDFDLITGHGVLKIMTATTAEDIKELGMEKLLHVTNSKESNLYLPSIKDYQIYTTKESLELSLVGWLTVTKSLMKILTEFIEVNKTDFDINSKSQFNIKFDETIDMLES